MKGLKSKVIIALIMMIALVLGYQVSVQAIGEIFPRTSGSVPFWSKGHFILCREHTNSWKSNEYICKHEHYINPNGEIGTGANGAHGMAYFLHFGSKYGKGYGNEIQSWIWRTYPNFWNGQPIFNAGTAYHNFFKGVNTIPTEIEQFISGNGLSNDIIGNQNANTGNLGNVPTLYQAMTEGRIPVVDNYPHKFFTTEKTSDEDNRITEISAEEYNYLYQLMYVMAHIDSTEGKCNVSELKKHINNYQAELGMTVYKSDKPIDSQYIMPGYPKKDKDFYGTPIYLTQLDYNKDGQKDAWIWNYYTQDEKGNEIIDTVTTYYGDDDLGTTKFSDRIYLGQGDAMLQKYIDLYNGTYTLSEVGVDLGRYKEDKITFINLSSELIATYQVNSGAKGENLYKVIHELMTGKDGYMHRVHEIAKVATAEDSVEEIVVFNPQTSTYEFSGSTYEAARLYQCLVNANIFEKCANRFEINKSKAKVSIDRENKQYIMGPFATNYFSIKINGTDFMKLKQFNIVLQIDDKEIVLTKSDGKKAYVLGGTTIPFTTTNPYNLVTSSGDSSMPKNGEEFYIQLSQNAFEEIIRTMQDKYDEESIKNRKDYFLTNNDKLGAQVQYEYIKCISATLHFLQGSSANEPDTTFNRAYSQRLMTFDTKLNTATLTRKAYIKPDIYEFELIKEDQNENRLEGAEFALYGRYELGGEEIYVDLVNNNILQGAHDDTNKTFSVLKNITEGNYITGENGVINISNVPNHIKYNNKDWTLVSVIGKETKAPANAELKDTHFEITKVDNDVARKTIKNIVKPPYKITIKKVDENGNPIAGVRFSYWLPSLEDILKSERGEVTTNKDGIAIIESEMHSKLLMLQLSEEPDSEAGDYKYFETVQVLYTPRTDKDGNVTLEFFDSDTSDDELKKIRDNVGLVGQNGKIFKGIYRIITKDGTEKYAEDAKNDVMCGANAGTDIDIKIRNEEIKPYNIELLKLDEKGNQSAYLNGTKFKLNIVKDGKTAHEADIEVKNGKAVLENVNVYGENIKIYITETPNSGFKTKLNGNSPVIFYDADDDGNIYIREYSDALLNPVGLKNDNYKPAKVDEKTMTLQLGIVNETDEYSLKFRKVGPNGEPLQDATFTLAEKDENEELVAIKNGTVTSDEDGYMTYKGLTKTGNVTLYLYEDSAPEKYISIATKENPLVITYKYEPGSNNLDLFTIRHNGETIFYERELGLSIDEKTGDLGTLNSIFDLVNTPQYDLEVFTKVDKDGNPIKDMKFNVDITWTDTKGTSHTKGFVELESDENGKVICEDLEVYGNLKITVSEIEAKDSASDNYETIGDTLIFNCTTTQKNDPVWSDEVIVIKEDGNEQRYHVEGTVLVDDNGVQYPYIEIEEYGSVKYKVINDEKPYNLVIKKVNSVDGTAIPNVPFKALVFKNLTSERQTFEGRTNEYGEIVLEGITIFNNADDNTYTDRLSVIITEEEVPEGYKWHEYGTIEYQMDYLKYSSNGNFIPLTEGHIRVGFKKGDPNSQKLLATGGFSISEEANNKSHDVVIPNTPVYDLDLFDKKAIVTNSELQAIIHEPAIDFSNVLATGGIEFTADVRYMNATIQENVKVTFDGNGIVAHDIDTSSLFGKNGPTSNDFKLVLTETKTNGLVEIEPITIMYRCTYENGEFKTEKLGYQYGENDEIFDFSENQTNAEIVDGLIYIDKDGNHVLVNTPKTTDLVLKKFDEDGKAIDGVTFEGTVSNGQDSKSFTVTTGEEVIPGEAVINDITLKGDVTVVINKEYWKDGKMPEGMNYSELEFIKGDITISGIVINEDGQGNRTVDCSKAKVDDAHKDQVKINNATMAIEVTNKKLTYDIPMIKTSETDETLDQIMFNFIIKDQGEEDDSENNLYFNNIETITGGRMDLTGLNKFGKLVLVIEEVNSSKTDYKMLKDKVYLPYTATPNYETNKVDITFGEPVYATDSSDAREEVEVLSDENGKFIGIKVINHHEYSITLHKVMNVNDKQEELNETVTLKGFVTRDAEFVDKFKENNMSYEDFNSYINENATTKTEDTRFFNQETKFIDGKHIVTIDELDEFEERVYVYFIEELQENSSMTLIEEVLHVSFVHEEKDSEIIEQKDKLSFDKDNLDIEITVENDASAYKINFLKVDSKGVKVDSLAKGKFKFTLKEIDGKSTKAVDEVIIKLDDDGLIDTKDSTNIAEKDKKYIVDFRLTDDGYIQLDINKFGNLQLEIQELVAPKHFITNGNTVVIPYTAEPGNVTIGEGVSEVLIVNTNNDNEIGIEVKLPNDELPYDLPIYKVLKEDIDNENEEGDKATDIIFDVKFFELDGAPIMKEWSHKYTTEFGLFTVSGIEKYGEYYITLEETETGNTNIKPIPGIHVFKITAEAKDTVDNNKNVNEDAVKSIDYVGEGNISDQGKLTLTGKKDYAEYFSTSKTDKSTKASIARLEIANKKPVPYSLDLFKYCNTTNNPLNGVKFEASLIKIESESDKNVDIGAKNLLGDYEEDYIRVTGTGKNGQKVKDGQIIFENLELYGKYKLTLFETDWPDRIKQTFDKIEIIYATEDGKEIKVESIKVLAKEGEDYKEVEAEKIVNIDSSEASLKIGIKNIEKKTVPLYIYKVKYTDVRNETGELEKVEVPIKEAQFSGYVQHVGNDEIQEFNNELSDKNGMLNLGPFYMDGEVKVHIEEIEAPAGAGKIPATDIYINVNNEEQRVDPNNWSATTNAVEGIENNTIKIIDPTTVEPSITLAGIVWEDVKGKNLKGEDSYQDDDSNPDFTEGLYDVGHDNPMKGVVVNLYKKVVDPEKGETSELIKTITTNENGQYIFDKLNPFEQYYITFKYDGYNYESVRYLVQEEVQDEKGAVYEGTLKDALDEVIQKREDGRKAEDIWARNSKAVTDYGEKTVFTATTTQNKLPIGQEGAAIQYYPIESKFTIDTEKVNLYYNKKTGKYYTKGLEDLYYDKENGKYISTELENEFKNNFEAITYVPLNPSHQCINLGLKLKATFDLRLEKDVEKISAGLTTGAEMNWLYGKKPSSSMYQLELTRADIEKLQELYITYKIEITNEGESAGRLMEVADYYNSKLLGLEEVYYAKVKSGDKVELDEQNLRNLIKATQVDNKIQHMYYKGKEQNMIPEQTYSVETGIDKSTPAQTGQVRIKIEDENQNVNPGEKFVIYIKYKYNENPLSQDGTFNNINPNVKSKVEGSQYVTLGIAEIYDSISVNKKRDEDSEEGDLGEKFADTHQVFKNFYGPENEGTFYTNLRDDIQDDDEDTAPALKFVVGQSGKTVSGNVFDDTDGNNILTGKTEGDKFIPEDGTIKGIKVALWDANKTGTKPEQEVDTDENGSYRFTSVPAGQYYITFTYGNEKTVVPILEKQGENGDTRITEPKTIKTTVQVLEKNIKDGMTTWKHKSDKEEDVAYERNNMKSYNTFEFEAVDPVKYKETDKFWYAQDSVRGSDAKDTVNRQYIIDNELMRHKDTDNNKVGVMDNKLAEKMNAYKADLDESSTAREYVKLLAENQVTAVTQKFQLNIEPTTGNSIEYMEESETGESLYVPAEGDRKVMPANIDFGIKGREQSKLDVDKEVHAIRIVGNDNVDIVNVKYNEETKRFEGTAPILKTGTEPSIQAAKEQIEGAKLEVTYKITVQDKTEHKGEKIVVTVADYVQNHLAYDAKKNLENGWNEADAKEAKNVIALRNGKGSSVEINNKIDVSSFNTITTRNFELNNDNSYKESAFITLETMLADFNEMPDFVNYVEVIQTAVVNNFARKDAYSIPGNYDPVKATTTEGNIGIVTEVDKTGLEKDTSRAGFSITPETGENRATYYILAISLITVFAVGIILIKKKVLDK